jgi:hypothetical protein
VAMHQEVRLRLLRGRRSATQGHFQKVRVARPCTAQPESSPSIERPRVNGQYVFAQTPLVQSAAAASDLNAMRISRSIRSVVGLVPFRHSLSRDGDGVTH